MRLPIVVRCITAERGLVLVLSLIPIAPWSPLEAGAADIGGYLEQQDAKAAASRAAAQVDANMRDARAGDAEAQYQVGIAYLRGWGIAKDPVAATTWLREAADQGHARAQYTLAELYESGEGVPPSIPKARAWLAKAAQQGFAPAQVRLAALILDSGEPSAGVEALAWLEIAAVSGDATARRGASALAARLSPDELERVRLHVDEWMSGKR